MQAKTPFNFINIVALFLMALQIWMLSSRVGKSGMALAVGRDPAAKASHASAPASESRPEAPRRDYAAPVLGSLAKEYKDSPEDVTWGKYFTYLRELLATGDFSQASPADLIAANPSLNDLHVKVNDAGGKDMHLWSFPSIAESHAVIFAAPGKTTFIPLPLSIVLREGRIVPSSFCSFAALSASIYPVTRPEYWVRVLVNGVKRVAKRALKIVRTGPQGLSSLVNLAGACGYCACALAAPAFVRLSL